MSLATKRSNRPPPFIDFDDRGDVFARDKRSASPSSHALTATSPTSRSLALRRRRNETAHCGFSNVGAH